MSHDTRSVATDTVTHHDVISSAPVPRRREPRFGLCPPRDGSPAPFRVLVSHRWLVAGLASTSLWLAGIATASRRWRPALLVAPLVAGLLGLLSAFGSARRLRFERVTIPVADLPPALDGFRIVQISDMHLGWPFTASHVRRAVRWAREQQPDMIALTGDFVAARSDTALLCQTLDGIAAPSGVFAVFGNHDYWTDWRDIERLLNGYGVAVLRNESRRLEINGAALRIVGVDCVWEGLHDLDRAFDGRDAGETVIVLAHEPDIADEIAGTGAILQLSGHTHAGHFSLPWLGPAFLPRHGFRYYRGLQRVGKMWLYVSRGIGGYPLRLGAPPEVTELTLRRG